MPSISPRTSTLLQRRGIQKEHIDLFNSEVAIRKAKAIQKMRQGNLDKPTQAALAILAKRLLLHKSPRVRRAGLETLLALGKEEAFMQLEAEMIRKRNVGPIINILERVDYSNLPPHTRDKIYNFVENKLLKKIHEEKIPLTENQRYNLMMLKLI